MRRDIGCLVVAGFEEKNGVAGFCEIDSQGGAARSTAYDNVVVGAVTAAAAAGAATDTKRWAQKGSETSCDVSNHGVSLCERKSVRRSGTTEVSSPPTLYVCPRNNATVLSIHLGVRESG